MGVVDALWFGRSRDEQDVAVAEVAVALRESLSRFPTGDDDADEVMEEEGSDRGISSVSVLEKTTSSWAAALVSSWREEGLCSAATGVGGVVVMVVGSVLSSAIGLVVWSLDMTMIDYS